MKNIYQYYIYLLIAVLSLSSCEKLIEIPESKSQVESSVVFENTSLAISALLGSYYTLGTVNNLMKNMSLYADEYNYTSITNSTLQFRDSQLLNDNSDNTSLWRLLYSVIYQSNAVIEGIDQSPTIPSDDARMLKAEARFLRAYANFYLVNLYEKVPLILTTDVNLNKAAMQVPAANIYSQIEKDLFEAQANLNANYTGAGKVRANLWAVRALLARVYLYQNKWAEAARESSAVINSGLYTPLPSIGDVFLTGSKETILQLWVVNGFLSDAATFIPATSTTLPVYPLTEGLYNSFETTDLRRNNWIATSNVTLAGATTAYCYPYKYKNRATGSSTPEYIMTLRLSEQYLIRAEALAEQGDISGAMDDLNIIRTRAGLFTPLPATLTQQQCLQAVAKERRLELFSEWSHRFLDLKRTLQLDQVMALAKSSWRPAAKALPIPLSEITYNPNLIQNEGY